MPKALSLAIPYLALVLLVLTSGGPAVVSILAPSTDCRPQLCLLPSLACCFLFHLLPL
jgi:hypothetical protein